MCTIFFVLGKKHQGVLFCRASLAKLRFLKGTAVVCQITPRTSDNQTYKTQVFGLFFLFIGSLDVCFGDGWRGLHWFAYLC
jgi:hypothetical protein